MKKNTKKLTTMALMCAAALVLLTFTRMPLFPQAPFLEFELSDTPIFLITILFGPISGLVSTLVVSIIQGITLSSQSGPVGIIMHFFATGSFVLTMGLFCRKNKKFGRISVGLGLGCVAMTLTMVAWNLAVTPFYMNVSVELVKSMLLPVFIPFNLIKSAANAIVAFLVYRAIGKIAEKFFE